MDLAVARGTESCGIDLIRFPGQFDEPFPLDRYKMFHRAGFRIVPIPYSRWLADRQLWGIRRTAGTSLHQLPA